MITLNNPTTVPTAEGDRPEYSPAKDVYYYFGYVGVFLDPQSAAQSTRMSASGFPGNKNNLQTAKGGAGEIVKCYDLTSFSLATHEACVQSLVQGLKLSISCTSYSTIR